jgi:hypothetical protein
MAMFGIFPDPTPEQAQQIKEYMEREEMEGTDAMNSVQSWFSSAGVDDLMVLRRLIGVFQQGQAPAMAYWDGMAASLLLFKHDVCIKHGINHDDHEIEKLLGQPSTSTMDPGPDPNPDAPQYDETHPGYAADMVKYDLEEIEAPKEYDNSEQGRIYIRCRSCHHQYVSLADRALRPVGIDGCEGCQNKAKWG